MPGADMEKEWITGALLPKDPPHIFSTMFKKQLKGRKKKEQNISKKVYYFVVVLYFQKSL